MDEIQKRNPAFAAASERMMEFYEKASEAARIYGSDRIEFYRDDEGNPGFYIRESLTSQL